LTAHQNANVPDSLLPASPQREFLLDRRIGPAAVAVQDCKRRPFVAADDTFHQLPMFFFDFPEMPLNRQPEQSSPAKYAGLVRS